MFKAPVDIEASWVDEPATFSDMVEFLSWFDTTTSVEETVAQAASDWSQRLTSFPQFQELQRDACLEIGFGGGRLLAQAATAFHQVHGVDIHNSFAMTQQFLTSQGVDNAMLHQRQALERVPGSSIDFIYSFIVFQHFAAMTEVDFYLHEIRRLLKPGGMAHLFFGKLQKDAVAVTDARDFHKRACSLFVDPGNFRARVEDLNFKVVDFTDRLPKRVQEPPGPGNESGQARVLFMLK